MTAMRQMSTAHPREGAVLWTILGSRYFLGVSTFKHCFTFKCNEGTEFHSPITTKSPDSVLCQLRSLTTRPSFKNSRLLNTQPRRVTKFPRIMEG